MVHKHQQTMMSVHHHSLTPQSVRLTSGIKYPSNQKAKQKAPNPQQTIETVVVVEQKKFQRAMSLTSTLHTQFVPASLKPIAHNPSDSSP
jgi:hypothetical protein